MSRKNIGNYTPTEKAMIKEYREKTEEAIKSFQSEIETMVDDYEEEGMIHNFEKLNQSLRRVERFSAMHAAIISVHVERNTSESE